MMNVLIRDLNIEGAPNDARRIEIIANNLPLFGGSQLAIDTTLISPIRANGLPTSNAHARNGIALARARRRKERTYPELVGEGSRCRLVVVAIETGGRFSTEAINFLQQLAHSKARSEPNLLQKSASISWLRRWINILACASQRALAGTLLHLPGSQYHNLDGFAHALSDVLTDSRWESGPSVSRMQ